MFRFVLAVGVVLTAALTFSSYASAYKVSDPFREKLGELRCGDLLKVEGSDAEVSLADALAMLSPWSPNLPKQVETDIATDSKLPRSDWQDKWSSQAAYAEGVVAGDIQPTTRVEQIAERRLATVEATALADARSHGAAVCDIMRVHKAVGPKELDRLRKTKPGNAMPYAVIGQALMTAAGCEVGSLDGGIGPKSITAWSKFAPGEPLDKLIAKGPGWLLQLYGMRARAPSCSPSALSKSGPGLLLAKLGTLYSVHRVTLLQQGSAPVEAPQRGDDNCSAYRAAFVDYARAVIGAPPDAALKPWFELALRGLKNTLACLDGADTPEEAAAIRSLFFGQGLHVGLLAGAEPRIQYTLAASLLQPLPGQPNYADRAVELLRAAYESAVKQSATRPAPSPEKEGEDAAPPEDDTPLKAAVLLAWAYESGTGVTRDEKEARRWRALARKHAPGLRDHPWQLNAKGSAHGPGLDKAAIDTHAGWLLSLLAKGLDQGGGPRGHPPGSIYGAVEGGQLLVIEAAIPSAIFHRVVELADLYVRHTSARVLIERKATPLEKFALATVLVEGHGSTGRQPQLGIALMEKAAAKGISAALVRVAQAYELGFGVPVDAARARKLYEQAAGAGQMLGHLALARLYDDGDGVTQDLALADRHYRAAMAPLLKPPPPQAGETPDGDPLKDDWFEGNWGEYTVPGDHVLTPAPVVLVDGLRQQMMKPSAYFRGMFGEKLLADLLASTPIAATHIGKWYLCADCGSAVKPDEAARWLRRGAEAGSTHSAYVLARLVMKYPELAGGPDEATKLLKRVASSKSARALEAEFLLATLGTAPTAPPEQQKHRVHAQCSVKDDADPPTRTIDACIDTAYRLAIGAVSLSLVEVGYEVLLEWATKDAPTRPKIAPDDTGQTDEGVVVHLARSALVDVLSLYGDFRGALKVLRDAKPDAKYSARNQAFSRLLLAIADSKGRNLSADFEALLASLEGRGDLDAGVFRKVLAEQRERKIMPALLLPVGAAQDAFRAQLGRGGFSYGLAAASRELSLALAAAGNKTEALVYELVALNASMEASKAAIEAGPLPTRLIEACQLARSSERVKSLGYADVATVLAKQAVNLLQEVRQTLTVKGLPQSFRTCFAKLTEDQYRPLIALFMDQGRKGEAGKVAKMLEDAEVFEYVGLDRDYVHRAFDKLALNGLELAVLQRALSVKPIVTPDTVRYELLRQRSDANVLTETEKLELEVLGAKMDKHNASFDGVTAELLKAVEALKDPERRRAVEALDLEELNLIKGELQEAFGGKAAVLHFVVLPDRMYGLLTTRTGHKEYKWLELGGKPFEETALNPKIDALRAEIDGRFSTERTIAAAEDLYRVLLVQSSFERELEAAGVELLLLSLDRRLRYVPFAALHTGKGWLAEKYAIAMLPKAVGISLIAPAPETAPTIRAFAMSEAVEGFRALEYAADEVLAIVKTEERPGAPGIYKGRAHLNKDFTRQAFQDALVRLPGVSPPRKIVHVSSHFQLGDSDASSFLLLGTGEHLTLKEIKEKSTRYDFSSVDLLTLSACSTAYASATAGDGRELQSLAAIARSRGGARAVLATLWPVLDSSTAAFMERFYRLQTETKPPRAVALAEVQREFIRSGQKGRLEPYYWAPFVLIGNWQ